MKTTSAGRGDRLTTTAYLSMLRRMVRAGGRRVAAADVEDLVELLALDLVLREAQADAVTGLRARGYTWQDIGTASGTTRQAALMRWASR